MKKKYVLCLVVISIMFLFVLTMGTGYGVWLATNNGPEEKTALTLNCFKVYFSNNNTIEMKNIIPLVNEEGKETSPSTLTITNICEDKKELQVRLNVLNGTTAEINALTIQAAGNIERDITLYKNLSNSKSTEEDVLQSKIIGMVLVEPNETVRTNIKFWFDEKKAPNMSKDSIFKAKFELIDTESSAKAFFADYLITNMSAIEKKGIPNLSQASFLEEGMFSANTDEGKTYYYRGVVNNNYVKFANLIWRIVRINSDGTIRLILDKSSSYQKYSKYGNFTDNTAFTYLENNVMVNNYINDYLYNWYNEYIINKELDKYIIESTFCNDSGLNNTNNHIYFRGYDRIVNNEGPVFTCNDTNVSFGGKYKQKVGLVSVDEVALAGGFFGINNQNYYLYNGENFFTATPAEFYYNNAYMFIVNNTGAIGTGKVIDEYGIRPVINLIADVTVSGSGTINDPYTIDIE